jgi:outer membrane protein assembly factor BamE
MPMPRVLLLLLALQLSACGWLAPYRIDIQQGNFVSQEMVAQLKRGMTKEQVRFVLGTPLVTDIFHANRWDYVYLLDRPGQPRVQRRLAVFFEDDRLARVEGDVVAAAAGAEPAQ